MLRTVETSVGSQEDLGSNPNSAPHLSCVTLSKGEISLNLCFLFCKMEVMTEYNLLGCCED